MITSARESDSGMEYLVDGVYYHFSKLKLVDILAYWHTLYPKITMQRHAMNEEMKLIHKQKQDLISLVEQLENEKFMLLNHVKRLKEELLRK